MAFPSNPINGDTYLRYGRTYEYDANLLIWKVKKSGISIYEVEDVDLTTVEVQTGDYLQYDGSKFVPFNTARLISYATIEDLPLSVVTPGQMAFVQSNNRLYIWNGNGWFNVALVNTSPTITSGPNGSYAFATDGTPIVLTLEAQDPEEVPIAWSYVVTSGALGSTATVQQEGNVFTITPSADTEDAGQFSITFTASDGVNLATAVSSFTLAFDTPDQYYNKNSLLIKTGSTAGLNNITFVDESTNGLTVTRNGDVYQGSYSPYSPAGWSAYFDGSTSDYLRISDDEVFQFGSGDFTIEAWVYPTSWTDTALQTILSKRESVSGYWRFGSVDSDGTLSFRHSSMTPAMDASGVLSLNQWQHVAVTRSSSTFYMYVNGQQVATTTTGGSTNISYIGSDIRVGASDAGGVYRWRGYIADVRLIKGTALYTSNFTPPTEPLTAISGTSLLTCQNNQFIDNSSNNFTITRNGDAKIVTFSPFLPSEQYDPTVHGGSAYFDGSGDYLTADITPVSNLGATTYTIEGWVWINRSGNRALIGAAGTKYYIQWNTSTFYIGDGATNMSTSWTAPLNRWVHIAVSRDSGGTTRAFIDGTLLLTNTTTLQTGSLSYLEIGRKGSTAYIMDGYISNFRYVAGTALYTSDFTPPTEPLTAVSGTDLLLNMNNAGIYDEVAKNNIQIVGNTTTSTTQTKYNDTSMYFDGTGDYLSIPNSAEYRMGSSNFTIEAWIYPTATSSEHTVVSLYGYTSNRRSWSLGVYQGQLDIRYDTTGTSAVTSRGGVITANQWYHVAYVRDGSSFKGYLNGTEVTSATTTSALYDNQVDPVLIGAIGPNVTGYFSGYISDVRITKGVARYTANFTPPTAALGFSSAE